MKSGATRRQQLAALKAATSDGGRCLTCGWRESDRSYIPTPTPLPGIVQKLYPDGIPPCSYNERGLPLTKWLPKVDCPDCGFQILIAVPDPDLYFNPETKPGRGATRDRPERPDGSAGPSNRVHGPGIASSRPRKPRPGLLTTRRHSDDGD